MGWNLGESKMWNGNVENWELKNELKNLTSELSQWELKPESSLMSGEWRRPEMQHVCEKLDRVQLGLNRLGSNCSDEELIRMVKNVIQVLIGAEQSYIQLGYLCLNEKFTLTNTAEFFRLCGLRTHWLANNLIGKSFGMFNVTEWINNTRFDNLFKVPTKEELATNNFTGILKNLFMISLRAEQRVCELITGLGDRIVKMNSECTCEGLKWLVNFVVPYEMKFVREMKFHFKNIEMCNNGYLFDKYEMKPLVIKIEEFIHCLIKMHSNVHGNTNKWIVEKVESNQL